MRNKADLLQTGLRTMLAFCAANNITPPQVVQHSKASTEGQFIKHVGTCAYYRERVIHIAPDLCAHPNPLYSWPGYISDRTPFGVIQHELGHYVDELRSGCVNVYRSQHRRGGNLYSDKVRADSGEPAITSYSPDSMEWFAEVFRLFVTNPSLLRVIRPRAYAALETDFTPCTMMKARDILRQFEAPQRVFDRLNATVAKLR